MTFASPVDGAPVGLSFIEARSVADLVRRREMIKLWMDATCGMLGRSPDFMNVFLTGLASAADTLGDKDALKSKSEIYRDALPRLNSGKLRLLDHPRLVNQLCSLERSTSRNTGKEAIDHPAGLHDDLANAACGALVFAGAKKPLFVHPDVLRRSAMIWNRPTL